MKYLLFCLALLAGAASAQPVTTAGSTSQATGAAVNAGVQMSNYFEAAQQPLVTRAAVDYSGMTKPSASQVGTPNAPLAGLTTCADTGVGAGASTRAGGLTLAFGTGPEEGCDTGRDVNMVSAVFNMPAGMTKDIAVQRICLKKEVKTAITNAGYAEQCRTAQEKQARAQALLDGQSPATPVATRRQPMPWQAGG